MRWLKYWLANWLMGDVVEEIGKAALESAKTMSHIGERLTEQDHEIDRLRGLIYATPDAAKKTLKPRTWREAKQLLGQD